MTVGQNVAFPLIEHTKMKKPERGERVEQVLRMVGLPDVQKKMPGQLSGGQRKRVALAAGDRAGALHGAVRRAHDGAGPDPLGCHQRTHRDAERGTGDHEYCRDARHDKRQQDRGSDGALVRDGGVVCDGEPEKFHQTSNQLVQRFINGQADEEDLKAIREGFEKR